MTVTYKIKKKDLYISNTSEMTRTKEDSEDNVNSLNLLVCSIQAMISEKNSKVKVKELKNDNNCRM